MPNVKLTVLLSNLKRVRESKKNLGVFATDVLPKGWRIPFVGTLVEPSKDPDLYAFTLRTRNGLNKKPEELVMLPRMDCACAYVNDYAGCVPEYIRQNKQVRALQNLTTVFSPCGLLIYFETTREVEPGEELLADYGKGYWRTFKMVHSVEDFLTADTLLLY